MKKLLALTLVLVTAAGLFAGCSGGSEEIVLPEIDIADTKENRQAAIIETAKAYYRKNPYIQYDCEALGPARRAMGVRNGGDENNTPEMAGPQRTAFHVCSYYTYQLAYQTFGYRIMGSWAEYMINPVATGTAPEVKDAIVWQHTNDADKTKNMDAMASFRAALQPGDIINYNRHRKSGSAHAVLWCGDITGDGKGDILNVDGKYYDGEAMKEVREEDGAVLVNTKSSPSGEYFFFDEKAYDYYPLVKDISILRLTDEKHAAQYPLTLSAKTRLLYPGLTIFFEAEQGIYGAVAKGGEYTFTLKLKNEGEKEHEGILVQLPVPKNAEIVKVNGEKAKNKTVKLTVDLPVGAEGTISYTVKATGNVGDVIETGVGYVHGIHLPSLNVTITSANPAAQAVQAALEANAGKNGEEFLAGYLNSMGQTAVPAFGELREALYQILNMGESKVLKPKAAAEIGAEYTDLAKMQIPEFFGGKTVITDIDSLRVKELRNEDLQAGDVLIWQKNAVEGVRVAVHNGEKFVCAENGRLNAMEQWKLDEFIVYEFFIALRPAAAK